MATTSPRWPRRDDRPADRGRRESERRRDAAHAVLDARRESIIRQARRVLLTVLLERGAATMDDVRVVVIVPPGVDPVCLGSVPGAMARAGIIRADGAVRTSRPMAHARPLTVWRLVDRDAAEGWLRDHPELPLDDDHRPAHQSVLWPPDETSPMDDATGPVLDYAI